MSINAPTGGSTRVKVQCQMELGAEVQGFAALKQPINYEGKLHVSLRQRCRFPKRPPGCSVILASSRQLQHDKHWQSSQCYWLKAGQLEDLAFLPYPFNVRTTKHKYRVVTPLLLLCAHPWTEMWKAFNLDLSVCSVSLILMAALSSF